MKRTDLVISKQNNVDTIKYVLGAADVYDDRAADKIAQLGNAIPIQYQDEDGKRSVTAYAHEDTTLETYMKNVLTKRDVLCVLSGLVSVFEIGAQGIPVSYIVKDASYIYVNRENLSIKAVLIPIKQDVMPLAEIPVFFREIISGMRFDEIDTDNYVAKLLTAVNADDFSTGKMKSLIDSMLEEMGLFVSKDNGLMGMSAGGAKGTNREVKVNKLGVMNNMRPQGQMINPQGQIGQPMNPGQAPQMRQPMPPQGQMGQPINPGQAPQMRQPMPPQGQMMNPGQAPQMRQPMPPQGPMGQPMNPGQAPQMPKAPMPPQGQPMNPQGQMGQPMPKPAQPSSAPQPINPQPVAQPSAAPQMPKAPMPQGQMRQPMNAGQAPQMGQPMPKPAQPSPAPQPINPQPAVQPSPAPQPNPAPQQVNPTPQPVSNGPIMEKSVKPLDDTAETENAVQVQEKPQTEQKPEPRPEVTMGNLVGQLGTKPVPHLIRKKTGETINITKSEFAIGKSHTKADYAIENNTAISRVHCIIVQRDGVNYIKDNNSTNHTFVDGVELQPGKEMLLKNKMKIQLGDEEFTFLLRKGE